MSVARTGRRRRKQAAQGFNHIARRKRPRFRKSASGKAQRRAEVAKRKAAEMRTRDAKK